MDNLLHDWRPATHTAKETTKTNKWATFIGALQAETTLYSTKKRYHPRTAASTIPIYVVWGPDWPAQGRPAAQRSLLHVGRSWSWKNITMIITITIWIRSHESPEILAPQSPTSGAKYWKVYPPWMLESYLAWLHFFVLSQDYSSKNVEGTRTYFVSKRVIPFQMSRHWKWTIFIISFFLVFSLQMSLATSWRTNLFCFRIDLLLLGLDLETILWPNAFQAPCQWLATVFKPTAAEVRDHQPCDHWLPWRRVRGRVSLEVSFDVCAYALAWLLRT